VTGTAKVISCKDLVRAYKRHGRKDTSRRDGVRGSVKPKFSATKPIAFGKSRKKNKLDSVRYQDEMMGLGGYCFVLVFTMENSPCTIDTAT
jgi:hypothetical protein